MNIGTAIKNSFEIVWKNLILTQPPILFLLVMSLLMGGFNRLGANSTVFLIFGASLIFLSIAFLAGWFNMAKKTIAFQLDETIANEEKVVQSYGLVKHFFPGVGEYFLSVLGCSIIFIILSFVATYFAFKIGSFYFGTLDIEFLKKSLEISTATEMQLYLNSLSEEKLLPILTWFSYLFLLQTIVQLIIMWWAPALYYKTKNPIIALWLNLKFLFKHFFASIGLLLFLVIVNIFISLVTSILGNSVVLSLISFLLFFFYVTYYVVVIFLYYGQNGEKTAEDYINSGDDCDGEKLAGGSNCEEN